MESQRPAREEARQACVCGHVQARHVASSLGKRYCIEQGCHCGNFVSAVDRALAADRR